MVVVLAAVVCLTGGGVRAATPASGAWSVVPTPSRPAPLVDGSYRAVACPTPTRCVTVGSFDDGARFLPLVGQSRNGTWSIESGSAPSATKFGALGELDAVACPTSTLCFAVGDYFTNTSAAALIERWNGTNWAVVPTAVPGKFSTLVGISCPSRTSCFAVGYSNPGKGHRTLIERWNGKSWTIVPSPTPHATGRTTDQFTSISCATTMSCMAVGTSGEVAGGGQYLPILGSTFAEHWNGKVWAVVKSRNPGSNTYSALSSVACPTSTSCLAVGTYQGAHQNDAFTLTERWNGTAWAIVSSPNSSGATNVLSGISCPAVKTCFAVGVAADFVRGVQLPTLVERWDGAKWSIVNKFTMSTVGSTTSIACPSVSNCVAVGAYLIQKWNGTSWSVVTTGASNGRLSGISCPAPTQCMAVGHFRDYSAGSVPTASQPYRTLSLIERYDGTSWHELAGPNPPGAKFTVLDAIACPTSTACFAVGSSGGDLVSSPFVARWDGTTWSAVADVPRPPVDPLTEGDRADLLGVSCPDISTCFAVGRRYTSNTGYSPLIERWNGSEWSIVAGPAAAGAYLDAISCVSASACFAVGSGGIIERYDGTSWSVVNPSSNFSSLDAISCTTSTSCFATGSVANPAGLDGSSLTLVERWDGHTWSVVPSPSPAKAQTAALLSVSCATASRCVAVGDYALAFPDDDVRPSPTLVEQWDGVSWSIVPSVDPVSAAFPASPTYRSLVSVACAPNARCMAVGSYETEQTEFTLAERAP